MHNHVPILHHGYPEVHRPTALENEKRSWVFTPSTGLVGQRSLLLLLLPARSKRPIPYRKRAGTAVTQHGRRLGRNSCFFSVYIQVHILKCICTYREVHLHCVCCYCWCIASCPASGERRFSWPVCAKGTTLEDIAHTGHVLMYEWGLRVIEALPRIAGKVCTCVVLCNRVVCLTDEKRSCAGDRGGSGG